MTNKAVLGIVLTPTDAQDLIADLLGEGFAGSDISLLTRGEEHAVPSTLLAPLERVAPIAISDNDSFVAAGPMQDRLRSLVSGRAIVVGRALMDLGMTEKLALRCEAEVYWGSTLVAVHGQESSRANLAMLIFTVAAADHIVVVEERAIDEACGPTAVPPSDLGV